MTINKDQLRDIIKNSLIPLGLHSSDAEAMLMGTAAQESQLGTYFMQLGNGPARGIFQMEPATLRDIYDNYLQYRHDLADIIYAETGIDEPDYTALQCDLRYQIIMARVHYLRVNEPLPGQHDITGQAIYWKKYYNTALGAGTPNEYVRNYNRFVV